ncbi:MAG: hypothetical protein EXQ97_08630 [Alphaproteobacteria bacterium]|nr:hypothetical protein [Alphaproteobacteria bacterium]
MRRWLAATILMLPVVAGDGPARAQEQPNIASESLDYFISLVRRADWGTPALHNCVGKRYDEATMELPSLQEGVALTLLAQYLVPARPVLEDYVTCTLAAGRLDALAEAVDLRARLERWNGGVIESRASRVLSNRLAIAAALLYAADGRYGRQAETLVKLADFHDRFDDSGTMACKTLSLARLAAQRADDSAVTARVGDAARRLVCPERP